MENLVVGERKKKGGGEGRLFKLVSVKKNPLTVAKEDPQLSLGKWAGQ